MAQTKEGALKVAAHKAGISVRAYQQRIKNGEKWCTLCKRWHAISEFGKDASRGDGLATSCNRSRNTIARLKYKPKPPLTKGRSFVQPRDGDAKQARRRVNYFVESGLIPHPNTIPCEDCGHTWKLNGRRHEYDHYLGYAAENHEHVQCVCSRCHHAREAARSL